jgi:hypothetical protein
MGIAIFGTNSYRGLIARKEKSPLPAMNWGGLSCALQEIIIRFRADPYISKRAVSPRTFVLIKGIGRYPSALQLQYGGYPVSWIYESAR